MSEPVVAQKVPVETCVADRRFAHGLGARPPFGNGSPEGTAG